MSHLLHRPSPSPLRWRHLVIRWAGALALLAAPACSNAPPSSSARRQPLAICATTIGDPMGGAEYGGGCPGDGTCPLASDGNPDCSDPDCGNAPNCLDDGKCSVHPDGAARCDDPDCAGSPPCAPDSVCSQSDAGAADCNDPDCATDPACDHRCEPAGDGTVDCGDPDCAGEPQCGSDGHCRVEDDGAVNCGDPDCAEAPECTGDGQCSETSPGKPNCSDPDCASAAECNPDDVCELDDSGHVNCDDPDCADQRECRSDGVCSQVPGPGPGPSPFPGPITRLGISGMVSTAQVVGPDGLPDCNDPDCDEEPACAPDDPPPPPPTKVITFPELLAVQHIRSFKAGDYVDEILATEPWQSIAAVGDATAIAWVASLEALVAGLSGSANPESPWHVLSNGRELIQGVWRNGQHIDAYWNTKEYRSWLQLTSNNTTTYRPQIKCKSGKLLKAFNGQELNGGIYHSHGYTPDPAHITFTAGEAKTGSPWHSYTVNGANDALTWNARVEARISRPARVVSFNLLGFDAPFIYSKLKYTLRCDGTYSIEAEASNFPTVTLYVNRRATSWRTQRGIARFLKSGSAGRMDAVGVGPTAPGAVYDSIDGKGDVVDE
jgi:hypothetical protein